MLYRLTRRSLEFGERTFYRLRQLLLSLPQYLKERQTFNLVSLKNSNSLLLRSIPGRIETQFLPDIYNVSFNGCYMRHVSDRELWRLNNASFRYRSNFVRFSDQTTFNPKIGSSDSELNLPGDHDLVKMRSNNRCDLITGKQLSFESVFHLTGVNSNNWAHFLVEYFPKFYFLEDIARIESSLKIILYEDVDPHILRMIQDVIADYPGVDFEILPCDAEVLAERLYYVSNDSYIADSSPVSSISHIKVSNSTTDYLLQYHNKYHKTSAPSCSRRLFLGRIGGRSISNYDQVLSIFKSLGFEEVFPHLLSFDEKIELFASAEIIAGPSSSAFANVYFSPNVRQVLNLCNGSRLYDPYLANLSVKRNFRLTHYLGRQIDFDTEDSNIEIDTTNFYNDLCKLFSLSASQLHQNPSTPSHQE